MPYQYLRYIPLLNDIKALLLTNNKLVPGHASSYIASMWRQKKIPAAGQLPAILIYMGTIPLEIHEAIGYKPAPEVAPAVRVVCGYPNENTTSAMITALEAYHSGITKIKTFEQSDDEVYTILDEIGSTLRISGKKLGDATYVSRALPGYTHFPVIEMDNNIANCAEMFINVKLKILKVT